MLMQNIDQNCSISHKIFMWCWCALILWLYRGYIKNDHCHYHSEVEVVAMIVFIIYDYRYMIWQNNKHIRSGKLLYQFISAAWKKSMRVRGLPWTWMCSLKYSSMVVIQKNSCSWPITSDLVYCRDTFILEHIISMKYKLFIMNWVTWQNVLEGKQA